MKIERYPENPLVTPADVKPTFEGWEVTCAFNAGVIEFNDEILMLMRVAERPINDRRDQALVPVLDCEGDEPRIRVLRFGAKEKGVDLTYSSCVRTPDQTYLTTISHLRLARSRNGRDFVVDPTPTLFPNQPYEAFGLEDPRITRINDTYYIVYKGVAPTGITQCLATTKDFVNWERHGIIFCPENMDAMLFPEKINGRFVALHRPYSTVLGKPNMWVAYSEDLKHWGDHQFLMGCSGSTKWESLRVGGGAVPFLTEEGWVEIYHAATPENHYCLGAILLDKEHPERIIAKTPEPILWPEESYEKNGFIPNVVFTCGAIVKDDTLSVYYGAGDSVMAGADFSVKEILGSMRRA